MPEKPERLQHTASHLRGYGSTSDLSYLYQYKAEDFLFMGVSVLDMRTALSGVPGGWLASID